MENTLKPVPWHFTIVFDEDKAMRNGYDIHTLYDYVGDTDEPLGNVRIVARDLAAKSKEVELAPSVALSHPVHNRLGHAQHQVSHDLTKTCDEPGEDYLR